MSYQGDKLHGKFRAGDVRWSKQVDTITDYFLRPGQPSTFTKGGAKRYKSLSRVDVKLMSCCGFHL